MKNNKIFIIEDDIVVQGLLKMLLAPYGQIIQAFTLEEAKTKFAAEKDITHILVDGKLSKKYYGEKPETTELVIEMRRTFSGPMIAISTNEDSNEWLKMNGCSHAVYKGDAAKFVASLLES